MHGCFASLVVILAALLVTACGSTPKPQRLGTPARLRNIDQRNDSYYAVFECQ